MVARSFRVMELGIYLLALLLRLPGINQSLWLDEAVQVWASRNFSFWGLIWHYMPGDFNPPLYHSLMWAWIHLFGSQEWIVRLPSLVFGVASVWLAVKIARELNWPEKRALLAGLLLAVAPLHIYYSQENRMYMLAAFAVELAVWRTLVLAKRQNWRNILWLSLALLIMVFSHFLTLFALPVLAWFLWKKKVEPIKLLAVAIILAGAYLAYSPLLWRQLKMGLGWQQAFPVWRQTVGSFTLKAAFLLPVKFLLGRIAISPRWLYGMVAILLAAAYWLLPLTMLAFDLLKKKAKINEQLIAALVIIPPLAGFAISRWVSVFSYFRFLYILPFWYLLVVMELKQLGRLGNLATTILVVASMFFSGIYLFNPKFHREDWRGMVNWLRQNNNGGLVVILNQIDKPFDYYDKGRSQVCRLSRAADWQRCPPRREVFLVSYGLPIFDSQDKIRGKLLQAGYRLKQGRSFRKVGVEKWEEIIMKGTE